MSDTGKSDSSSERLQIHHKGIKVHSQKSQVFSEMFNNSMNQNIRRVPLPLGLVKDHRD